MVVQYEEINADAFNTLKKVFSELNVDVDDSIIHSAINKFDFKKLTGRLKGNEEKAAFFRKGIVGDWKNHYTKDDIAYFEQVAGDTLDLFGYACYSSGKTYVSKK